MKPIAIKTFSELNYFMKAGKAPVEVKPKHTGNWSIFYGKLLLEADMTYAICVEKTKVYKRFGNLYPRKELFSIKPYKIK